MNFSSTPTAVRTTSVALIAAAIAMLGSPAQAANAMSEFAKGRILVEAKPGLSDAELDKLLKVHGGKRRKVGQSRLHIVELPANANEADVVAKLSKRAELKFAELDRKVDINLAANDPYIGSAWHLATINAAAAWDSSQGNGVTIAVLDSGVNTSHPDLQGRIAGGFNVYDNNADLTDVCGHGTAVAGVAAASTNNGVGVAGVAGAARIMPVRIAFYDSTGCHAYLSTIATGLTYAADNGARIANISYGGVASSAAVLSAARYMKSKGGLVFVSAGNSNVDANVAPDPAVIVVSATDSADAKASFSSWGSFVSLSAPGVALWTTNREGSYGAWSGTSFSSPLTAGVAGLLMSARPDLSAAQIESMMYSTAVDLGTAGKDPVFGYGRVDAGAAMRAAMAYVNPVDATAPVAAIAAPLGSSSVSGQVAVNVNASDNVGVARVELKVNGTVVAVDSAAPYSFNWDSTGSPNGMANLVAVAYDAAGNAGSSATVAVNVANAVPVVAAKDTVAPTVVITNPSAGSVSGNVMVALNAADNNGAAGISTTLRVDGVLMAQGSGGSLSFNWNTRKIAAGSHTITATARDAAGNTTTASVAVTSR